MKQLIGWDQALGADGKLGGGLGVKGKNFAAAFSVEYPIEKVLEPVTKVTDGLLDKLEGIIPGDQKVFFDGLKAQYKKELLEAIGEDEAKPAALPEAAPEAAPAQ